ncbi:MAG: thioesterase family protein [Thermanaerothrix sp.]|nr:thioesterase family protein [Thermanaerothrix sp.]
MTMRLQPGLSNELTITVQESDSTRALGDETLPVVLSTPRLIAYLEHTAHHTILTYLDEGQTSVGTWVNVRHLAATPLGMQVRFRAELIVVEGRRLRFRVEAWDEVEKVAEGEHERFIIDRARFEERLAQKRVAKS